MLGSVHDVDLKLLRVFSTVARCGGFTAAQVELNCSQSAISTRMSQLEDRLGMRLCQRGHAGFKLTDKGEQVLEACDKLFESIDQFKHTINETSSTFTGELRFGIISNINTCKDLAISETIEKIHKEYPNIEISLYIGIETEIETRVLDGRLHGGLVGAHNSLTALDYQPIYNEEHVLYCSAKHPLFEKADGQLSLKDLENADFVSRDYLENIQGFSPDFPLTQRAVSPELEGATFFLLSGCYIAYLPTHYAEQWVERKLMRPLMPEVTRRTLPMSIISRTGIQQPAALKIFIQTLCELSSNLR